MDKRNLATVLWFMAGWWGGALAVGLLGLPSVFGLVPGVVAAVLVRWDPMGAFWPRTESGRVVAPINEFADGLGRDAGPAMSETDRSRS